MKNFIILLMLSLTMVFYFACSDLCERGEGEGTTVVLDEETDVTDDNSEDVVEAEVMAPEDVEEVSEGDATVPPEDSVEEPVEAPEEAASMESDPTEDPTSTDPVIIWLPDPNVS